MRRLKNEHADPADPAVSAELGRIWKEGVRVVMSGGGTTPPRSEMPNQKLMLKAKTNRIEYVPMRETQRGSPETGVGVPK